MATGGGAVIGEDGRPRCPWAGSPAAALLPYHDRVWGKRIFAEPTLFEALTLGVFEVGLSWRVVFGKRDGFIRAFHGFDVGKVAAMTDRDVDRLLHDPP